MIAIVTDSTAYFTSEQAQKLDITMLPIQYFVGEKSFWERPSGENGTAPFCGTSDGGHACRTKEISVKRYVRTFRRLLQTADQVLCLTLSSRLSSCYRNALAASEEFQEGRVYVFDTLTIGGGIQFLAERARRWEQSGLPFKQIVEKLQQTREKIGVVFSVDNLSMLRQGGRLSRVKQSVNTILNIRPILMIKNGSLVSDGRARGSYAQTAALLKRIPQSAEQVMIHFIQKREEVKLLYSSAVRHFPSPPLLTELGPVMEAHTGAGLLGAAWILP